jgi:hypothetical protein
MAYGLQTWSASSELYEGEWLKPGIGKIIPPNVESGIEVRMSSKDTHYQVGALVHAMHVTALIGCHRRCGSNAKTKLVNGMVSELKTVPSSNQTQTVTLITAIYSLGGQCRKVATLNSRSVKAGHVAAIPNEGNAPGTELVT